ncbi:hypothetical protein DVJ83_08345 [Deinococcus wulumuqiensis]|uniref:Uncharacterized protein n=1 Tax=Deinococcus wulumuqiensis TaxID=980427 RepID=A0A345IHJ6_9DEIO|nr:hypothetical protein [Deinococcus wulumuqiensis]AXG99168.1 hypothetical protein DVJ83_08345 [Deinococcus wulumuqiensis]
MSDFVPTLSPVLDFLDDHGTPKIHPLPIAAHGTPFEERPQGVWRAWDALPKTPLMVSVSVDGEPDAGDLNLDAALSVATLRSSERYWSGGSNDVWVTPLPLALLGIVQLPGSSAGKRTDRSPRLPVWASTVFAPVSGQPGRWAALCIGHADEVRELLSYIHEVGKRPAWGWTVEPLPLPMEQARALIEAQRPMPGRDARWTPPYHHDWVGAALEKLAASERAAFAAQR